jgi:hypothetical protein
MADYTTLKRGERYGVDVESPLRKEVAYPDSGLLGASDGGAPTNHNNGRWHLFRSAAQIAEKSPDGRARGGVPTGLFGELRCRCIMLEWKGGQVEAS